MCQQRLLRKSLPASHTHHRSDNSLNINGLGKERLRSIKAESFNSEVDLNECLIAESLVEESISTDMCLVFTSLAKRYLRWCQQCHALTEVAYYGQASGITHEPSYRQ